MSLGIVIKGPEGLVLAAESRVTIGAKLSQGQDIPLNFDNATKVLSFGLPHEYVGAVTYGLAAIGLRTAHSFLPELVSRLPDKRLPVEEFAAELSEFFMQQWHTIEPEHHEGLNMTFVVGGFDEGESYGRVFLFEIPETPTPAERNPVETFGITFGGQKELVYRLLYGYDENLLEIISNILNPNPKQVQALTKALEQLNMRIPLPATSNSAP